MTNSKSKKRLGAPKTRKIDKKSNTWTVKASPGPHQSQESVPIKTALRDHLKITEDGKEAERIVKEGKIQVDKKTVRDPKHPIGFMDVVTIDPTGKHYRANYNEKGKIEFTEIQDEEESKHKLGRVNKKQKIKGGKTQITLHDGKNLINEEVKTGDTVKINLPEKEVEKIIKLEEGNQAYITSGKHAGEIQEITGKTPGTSSRPTLIKLENIETQKDNIFPIGEKEPEIKTKTNKDKE